MKPKLILRIASIIMFLHLAGHTVGSLTWKDSPDPAIQETIKQMSVNKFMFMRASQTLAGHHEGFAFAGSLALLFFSIVLWIVSTADQHSKPLAGKIIFAVSAILLLWGIDELIYFFPFAASFSLLSSALGFYAFSVLKREG